MSAKKFVYFFGNGKAEGDGKDKNLLGGKGAGLAEMTNLGIPVPPGFTITTEACIEYQKKHGYPEGMWEQTLEAMKKLEEAVGKNFGSTENPLLVSVRSGARVSMPGMMDTVLNLGLNDETVKGLAKASGNERFAYDSYRRFIQMFGDVVLGVDHHKFEKVLRKMKQDRNVESDTELNAEDLKQLVAEYKKIVEDETGKPFPQDTTKQLEFAINAVFNSWDNQRAKTYRKLNKIPDDWGTAVNIVAMVFGNMGDDCGTGVAFTRNPSTGEKEFFGEFLINAQGEDVVAGIRTPEPIARLKDEMPEVFAQLEDVYKKLETHYKDMQDIEFTVERKKLYMLQTRSGKRTAKAAVKIAYDMFKEGLIDKKTAVLRVLPEQVDQLLHPMIDPKEKYATIAKGLPASPGAAVGKVVFSAEDAEKMAAAGEKVILVRNETSPEDIGGMHASEGILTATGGMTSHAAVVARGMGKCCVAGCGALKIDEAKKVFTVGDNVVKEGDFITINGSTGEVILGKVTLIEPELSGEFAEILKWADEFRTLGVRTNADTPHDSKIARDFGAEGIGLCRTEHMFFDGDRIDAVREMILAENEEGRRRALEKVKPYQKEDFIGIFKAMDGLPVTIRLLDPPLHEFIPHTDEDIQKVADASGIPFDRLQKKAEELKEFNPMLGHRGCRLGITFPEIYEMQVYAIMEAACKVKKEGVKVLPEIMIPLVGHFKELSILKEMVNRVAEEVMNSYNDKIEYLVGTMIELPRAALTADEIAEYAEFFSFGTNDLTQTTLGLSRDDSGKFLPEYVDKGIYKEDPFVSIDVSGVGQLVELGVTKGRKTRPNLKTGICGEHGGDPESIYFCQKVGLNYVSCSPYRVPVARLAAAHAALKNI
ncbi:pyruvate, phosphate dikinase [Deferribacterales bacterium Es71-Z0220]|jgi:pyruvate,orthophosphate dikinase|uniref:pyruvate, phosphate dikinase n=1 Tax=Deferrivibrio essentukiensis TaxID=2880922 RepID=UPI001F624D16|nr:pyruvate, phosphate dikinase [Deferrivibrio essentukiensis]MBZ4672383.1 pyruvate phosphate dikinase [Deferribacteraceae bacterium]MCB4203859.1 pyruvate, phosphate dikinase [Deferrivibrio essentukiensis]